MSITNVNTKKNPLLKRTEVVAQIAFAGVTPSMPDVQKELSAKLGAEEARVVIKRIGTRYGGGAAAVSAYVYDSEEAKKVIEPRVKEKKK